MGPQYHPSDWEKATYYHGVSVSPPKLIYRSNYLDTPFPRPTGRIQHVPTKIAHGVFNPRRLKDRKIRYSAIHATRFVTLYEDGQDSLGPVVIWIAVHPPSSTAEDAHLASPDILALLEANSVHGAVVGWFEDQHGNPSTRVFAFSTCHVLSKDPTVAYESKTGAPPSTFGLRFHYFQRGLEEIEEAIVDHREQILKNKESGQGGAGGRGQ